MTSTKDRFAADRYAVVRGLVHARACAFLYHYVTGLAQHGRLVTGDEQVPDTPCRYADPLVESLLLKLQPRIEAECGLSLHPTYSYFRVYKHGDHLPRHSDRPSCEISVTLNLGQQAAAPWAIWVQPGIEAIAVDLAPGDGMLYRGTEVPHWRDSFAGECIAQVFLHYVDQDGPCMEWKFDKRVGPGNTPHADAIMQKLLAQPGA